MPGQHHAERRHHQAVVAVPLGRLQDDARLAGAGGAGARLADQRLHELRHAAGDGDRFADALAQRGAQRRRHRPRHLVERRHQDVADRLRRHAEARQHAAVHRPHAQRGQRVRGGGQRHVADLRAQQQRLPGPAEQPGGHAVGGLRVAHPLQRRQLRRQPGQRVQRLAGTLRLRAVRNGAGRACVACRRAARQPRPRPPAACGHQRRRAARLRPPLLRAHRGVPLRRRRASPAAPAAAPGTSAPRACPPRSSAP